MMTLIISDFDLNILKSAILESALQRSVDDGETLLILLERDAGDAEHRAQLVGGDVFQRARAGALPGAGCGNAVERAVWKVMFPSTFCRIWWMWPLSTVTEPNRFR